MTDSETALLEVGTRAATDALRAYQSIKELRDLDVGVVTAEILLSYRPLTDLAEATRQLAAAEANKDQWGQPMCDYRHWQAVVNAHSEPPQTGITSDHHPLRASGAGSLSRRTVYRDRVAAAGL